MALNFPNNPVDGEIYEQFYWDATAGIWRNRQIVATLDNLADVSAATPSNEDIIIYDNSDQTWKAGNVNTIVTIPEPEPPIPVAFLLMGA